MRRLTVAVAACSLLPVMGSVSWQPSAQAGDALAGHPATRLLFTFDNGESLAPGSRVKDVAGVPDNGRVVTADGGRLRPVDHRKGRAAQFPRRCLERGCPRAIIAVHNRKALNPHRNAFSFGAQVRIKADQTAKTSTIVQKGDYDSRRGRWRLRVNRSEAKPYCLVKGSKRLPAPARGRGRGGWAMAHAALLPPRASTPVVRRRPAGRIRHRAHRLRLQPRAHPRRWHGGDIHPQQPVLRPHGPGLPSHQPVRRLL